MNTCGTTTSGDDAARTRVPAGSAFAKAGRRMHILVAEDNKINQMLITTYLRKFGHSFEVADDGAGALAAAAKGGFHLVLMDIQMPEMDGLEATAKIRALEGPARAVPIVALTANAMDGDEERYLAAGMDGYLAKPIVAASLFAAIDRFAGGSAEETAVSG